MPAMTLTTARHSRIARTLTLPRAILDIRASGHEPVYADLP